MLWAEVYLRPTFSSVLVFIGEHILHSVFFLLLLIHSLELYSKQKREQQNIELSRLHRCMALMFEKEKNKEWESVNCKRKGDYKAVSRTPFSCPFPSKESDVSYKQKAINIFLSVARETYSQVAPRDTSQVQFCHQLNGGLSCALGLPAYSKVALWFLGMTSSTTIESIGRNVCGTGSAFSYPSVIRRAFITFHAYRPLDAWYDTERQGLSLSLFHLISPISFADDNESVNKEARNNWFCSSTRLLALNLGCSWDSSYFIISLM